MFTISGSVCIDAPPARVWRVLSELEAIHVWVDSIRRSYCVGDHTRGVDAVRVCELGGNLEVRETIVEWVEGSHFSYRGEGAPLMKRATNRWTVEARGPQTLVTSSAVVELKGGFWMKPLEPLFAALATRLGSKSLASLKYLCENGRPFEGSVRKLLPVPSTC
jgi:carbon monoxide dehydrogenase subunit G